MKISAIAVSLLVLVSFLSTGCGSNAGKGIPKRIQCQVKVTKGGAPLEGVSVIMVCDALESGVNVSGTTDAGGVAQISTKRADFVSKGVPEGEYKVLLSKPIAQEDLPEQKTADELDQMSPPEKAQYAAEMERKLAAIPRDVPLSLESLETSQLTATVSSSGGEVLAVEVEDYQ